MQVPADTADWLDMVAVGALPAFVWHAPPMAFAWLAVAMAAPPVTLGLALGVYVDRWPLRRTLVLADLGRGLATAALVLAPDWPTLVAVVAVRAAADSAFGPAKQAALQVLVAPEGLVAANGLSQSANQATKVAAPALGAGLLALLDPRGVFLANALLSLLAALTALSLPPLRPAGPTAPGSSMWGELRHGVRLVVARPLLRGTLLLVAAATFAIVTYDTQIAPLVRALGQDEAAFGLLLTSLGVGGLLGGLCLAKAAARLRTLPTVAGATVLAALLTGALGLGELVGR